MSFYERLTNPEKPFIIAEIGSNHSGDIEKAKRLIDVAIDAGCDAAKFQSWHYNSLFAQSLLDEHKDMVVGDLPGVTSLEAINKKLAVSREWHSELSRYCQERGIIFCSTPFSQEHVDWLCEINVPFLKIASMDVVNLPLLKKAGRTGKPIVMSTGMATMSEVAKAVETIESTGNRNIILLHCVAVYPTPSEMINLKNIEMLKNVFGYPVGFSDHSKSIAIPAAAPIFGATVIEKHIKLDDGPCRDAAVSLKPHELRQMVDEIHNIAKAIGTANKILTDGEKVRRVSKWGRRSIITKTPLKAGDVITEGNVDFRRPGTGLSPDLFDLIKGRKLKYNKGPEELILLEDLE